MVPQGHRGVDLGSRPAVWPGCRGRQPVCANAFPESAAGHVVSLVIASFHATEQTVSDIIQVQPGVSEPATSQGFDSGGRNKARHFFVGKGLFQFAKSVRTKFDEWVVCWLSSFE